MAAIEAKKLNFTYPDATQSGTFRCNLFHSVRRLLFADGAIRQRQEHFTAAAARGDRTSWCFERAAAL